MLAMSHEFKVEIDQEEDGRWIAEIPALPGVMAYGNTQEEAVATVQALALRVVADRVEERKEGSGGQLSVSFDFRP
jgi:predicted RNase H-like HicB family nuclease